MAVLYAVLSVVNFFFALIYYFGPQDLKYLFVVSTIILFFWWWLSHSIAILCGCLLDLAGIIGGAINFIPLIVAAILGSVLLMSAMFEAGTTQSRGSHD